MNVKYLFILFCFCYSFLLNGYEPDGHFNGRVSKINTQVGLLWIKVDFPNRKYLNRKDRIELFNEGGSQLKCKGYIVGKTTKYLMIKIPEFEYCKRTIYLTPGIYLSFYSADLQNNLKMGHELVKILLKKRLAIQGKLSRHQTELEKHIEKVDVVNKRYNILKEKLESEWRDEIAALEEDNANILKKYYDLKIQMNEIDNKMEKYKIHDKNFVLDRWALDSKLYFEK